MQEFSSISVSSYEAGSLAERLTESSAEGWSVVSIVPTGSTVTAYLSRAASEASEPAAVVPDETVTDDAVADESAPDDTAADDSGDAPEAGSIEEAAALVAESSESTDWSPEPVVEETVVEETVVEEMIPEPTPMPTIDPIVPITPEPTPEPVAAIAPDPAPTPEPAPAPEPEPEPEPEPAPAPEPAPVNAAPAGWYADPSGRFELRYWDGGQWTEHVSRAGQQFTDPPVA